MHLLYICVCVCVSISFIDKFVLLINLLRNLLFSLWIKSIGFEKEIYPQPSLAVTAFTPHPHFAWLMESFQTDFN